MKKSIYKEFVLSFELGWFSGMPFNLFKVSLFEDGCDKIYVISIQICKLCLNLGIEKK